MALAVLGDDQGAVAFGFPWIAHAQQRCVMGIEAFRMVEAALLYPAVEIFGGEFVGPMEYRVIRLQEAHGCCFIGDPCAAHLERERPDGIGHHARIDAGKPSIHGVEHHLRATSRHIGMQTLFEVAQGRARIERPDAEHHSIKPLQILSGQGFVGEQFYFVADAAQGLGNVISGAHDIADAAAVVLQVEALQADLGFGQKGLQGNVGVIHPLDAPRLHEAGAGIHIQAQFPGAGLGRGREQEGEFALFPGLGKGESLFRRFSFPAAGHLDAHAARGGGCSCHDLETHLVGRRGVENLHTFHQVHQDGRHHGQGLIALTQHGIPKAELHGYHNLKRSFRQRKPRPQAERRG